MRVTIFTEGNQQLGLGHVIRCIAFYQAFEDEKANLQLIVNCDQQSEKLIKKFNHQVLDWIKNQNQTLRLLTKTDIAVIDSRTAPKSLYQLISSKVKLAVYLDDNLRINYPKGVIINRILFAQNFSYPKSKDISYLLGNKFIPLTRAFWFVPGKKIRKNIEHILITFGGSDLRNLTPKVLAYLCKNYPENQKTVVVGRVFQNIDEIEDIQDKNTHILYYPTGEILKNIMLNADIAITASGGTLFELARIGVPTISINIIDNQENNEKAWTKVKFIEQVGFWKDKNLLKNIQKALNKLKNQAVRKERSEIGRKFVDGKGSQRIIKYLLKKYKALFK